MGLAAGRIETVADGISGNNSPFNESLVTFLRTHHSSQFAVSELINHVCKITTYNADQTPIGGILDKSGHQGGEFVFRKKLDESGIWREALQENHVESYNRYLAQFPNGITGKRPNGQGRIYQIPSRNFGLPTKVPRGKYVDIALEKIESLEEKAEWEKAYQRNSIANLERYLQHYPHGTYRGEAEKRIEELLAKKQPKAHPQIWKEHLPAPEPKETMPEQTLIFGK